MTSRVIAACGAAFVLVTATPREGASYLATLAAQDPGTSVWSGVYTTEQAAAGEKIYFERCAMCHGDELGGVERAPALAGAQFLDAWHGQSLRRLLERVETMPPDMPLSGGQALDVLAFMLSVSELPAGPAPLPADRSRLGAITLERTKPGREKP